MTTPTTYDEIKKLAEKATPGPWTAERRPHGQWVSDPEGLGGYPMVSSFVTPLGIQLCGNNGRTTRDFVMSGEVAHDAAYIAAANPTAILALIDRLETAERERDEAAKSLLAVHGANVDIQAKITECHQLISNERTQREAAEERMKVLEDAVRASAERFREYERLHAAKPDLVKAARNGEMAAMCEYALSIRQENKPLIDKGREATNG